MSLRPGSKEARELFASSTSSTDWQELLNHYDDAVKLVSDRKKKPEFVALDRFWRLELRAVAERRSPKHLKLDEVSQVMKWKLIRGQFRPLQKLVDSNNPDFVVDCSTDAFRHIEANDVDNAFKSLCQLKGIGPATASALLAPFDPERCPFMADEVIESALPDAKRDYTKQVYDKMTKSLKIKAELLGGDWNAEMVGKALWVHSVLSAAGCPLPSLSAKTILDDDSAPSKKRKLK